MNTAKRCNWLPAALLLSVWGTVLWAQAPAEPASPTQEQPAPADAPAADDAEVSSEAPTDPAESAPAAEIATLVKQLGDADPDVREAATARLREIGEPALTALRKAMEGGDPETCTRADALIQRLTRPRVPAALPGADPGRFGPGAVGGVVTRSRSVSISVVNGVRTRSVEVTEAGRTVRITEGPGGIEMSVTGAGEDGQEQTTEFKAATPDELKQQHPEAFELYERHNGDGDGDAGRRLEIRIPNGLNGGVDIDIRGQLQDADAFREQMLRRREGILRDLRARRGLRGGLDVVPPAPRLRPAPVPGEVRPPGDDLRGLRERVRRQMDDLGVPQAQRERVLGQLDRMLELQARAALPLVDPFGPPVLPPDGRDWPADVGRHMAEYNRLCDELRRRMKEMTLPDPGDALPPPESARLGVAAVDHGPAAPGVGGGGVTLSRVLPGSRGEKMGLRAGDEIRTVNGKPVGDVRALRRAVTEAGGPLVIEGARGGAPLKLEEKP